MGEYALRAMMYMAARPDNGEKVQIQEIARAWDIPDNFLRKIIPQLSKAGLIYSQRGTGGGIALLKSSSKITALDIIEAVEGPFFLNKCLISEGFCEHDQLCAMHGLWMEAQEKLQQVLSSKTLAQLAEENQVDFS